MLAIVLAWTEVVTKNGFSTNMILQDGTNRYILYGTS